MTGRRKKEHKVVCDYTALYMKVVPIRRERYTGVRLAYQMIGLIPISILCYTMKTPDFPRGPSPAARPGR